ncbi:MAG: hypothetical protein AAGF26_02700 [Cyanobacteria bacterium P01_G01_bin.49]
MPVPNNFNTIKHFKDTLKKVHNRQVREYFRDTNLADDVLDISTPRGSLRSACLMQDKDTLPQAIHRYLFYHITVRAGEDFNTAVYGVPVGNYQERRRFRPQIKLFFKEDAQDVDSDYRPLTAELTCRLMDESSETITNIKINDLARAVAREFLPNNGYQFHKGKTLVSYNNPQQGYGLQIYAYSVSEGREVIKKILAIQNHTPDWAHSTVNENQEPSSAFPTIPPRATILRQVIRQPRKRPVGHVRFQYALLHLWGRQKPVVLCDRVFRFRDALERA